MLNRDILSKIGSSLVLILGYVGYKLYQKKEEEKERTADILYKINTAKTFIFNQVKSCFIPRIGMILGSGQNDLIRDFEIRTIIRYEDIPFFPISTVKGHTGKLILAHFKGLDIVIMQGRFHNYEGYTTKEVSFPVRVMKGLGIKTLVITNSSGGINPELSTGDVIVIKDHVYLPGLVGFSPLHGPNNEYLGERFVAMNNIYTKKYRDLVLKEKKNYVKEGVYCGVSGPCYETPTEVKFIRSMGCDIVGMSTIPEVVVAAHADIKVLVLGLVTNSCVDNCDSSEKPTHEEVCRNAVKSISNLRSLIEKFLIDLKEVNCLRNITFRNTIQNTI